MTIDILAVLRLSVGLIFLKAVIPKLRDPHAFAAGVAEYGVFPAGAARTVSLLLIALEGWIAVAHLSGTHLWIVAPVTIGLLLAFLVAVGARLWRGTGGRCHCFGDDAPVTTVTMGRLAVLLAGETVLLKIVLSNDAALIASFRPVTRLETAYVATIWVVLFYVCIAWLSRMRQIAALFNSKRRSAT
jgi:hypothetical protein